MLSHVQLGDTEEPPLISLVVMTAVQNFIKWTRMTAQRSDLVAARQTFCPNAHPPCQTLSLFLSVGRP